MAIVVAAVLAALVVGLGLSYTDLHRENQWLAEENLDIQNRFLALQAARVEGGRRSTRATLSDHPYRMAALPSAAPAQYEIAVVCCARCGNREEAEVLSVCPHVGEITIGR